MLDLGQGQSCKSDVRQFYINSVNPLSIDGFFQSWLNRSHKQGEAAAWLQGQGNTWMPRVRQFHVCSMNLVLKIWFICSAQHGYAAAVLSVQGQGHIWMSNVW
jgi:hypothetical protein